MKIGVLELLNPAVNTPWTQKGYAYLMLRQNASIMPQAISVWCRDLGHEVFYATYYGQRDPKRLLPDDLDLVFISAHTQASALAKERSRSEPAHRVRFELLLRSTRRRFDPFLRATC
jgi:hypothetical protein